MSVADPGSARSAAATSAAACRIPALAWKVTPGFLAWISTLSAGGLVKPTRCRTRSARPDGPES